MNITFGPEDVTLDPAIWGASWLPDNALPTTTLQERDSWRTFVMGDLFTDVFRYLFPNAKNCVTWSPTSSTRILNEGLRVDHIYCTPELL